MVLSLVGFGMKCGDVEVSEGRTLLPVLGFPTSDKEGAALSQYSMPRLNGGMEHYVLQIQTRATVRTAPSPRLLRAYRASHDTLGKSGGKGGGDKGRGDKGNVDKGKGDKRNDDKKGWQGQGPWEECGFGTRGICAGGLRPPKAFGPP